ncbi:urease accessory protein UreE [Natrialba sp. INN-245]|uniref:urease accessory protein UreE n=1 Tax=Natrialba sp. INN-245 TaxID=2690967 RepID=UPI0013112CCF|nr:urease accessory protein UreE [Natrialba sp. INN-245]MWV40644.1 urease accessory protein UreE [Natrialba sp. INN-245]
MERIDGIVGNVHADDELATLRENHEANGTLERVVVDASDRRRSRFRTTTDVGTDVGVVVNAPAVSSGDVLLVDDERMIVVAFEPRDALAVSLPEATSETLAAAVELGHRVGNQHWDLAVEDGTVYVPLAADRHIVERVVADVIPGSEIRETTVDADLFVTDLEGGHGDGTDHSHGHEHSHGDRADETDHSHGDNHSHGDHAGETGGDGHRHDHHESHGHSHEHDHDH